MWNPPRPTTENNGSVVIDAPLKIVAAALTDPVRKLEYEGGLEEETFLDGTVGSPNELGQPSEFMCYKKYHLVGLWGRDYVFKCTWTLGSTSDGKQTATKVEASTTHESYPKFPDKKLVRGWVMCEYTLTEMSPTQTLFHCRVNLDPLGNLPLCAAKIYGSVYPGVMGKRVKAQSLKLFKEQKASGVAA